MYSLTAALVIVSFIIVFLLNIRINGRIYTCTYATPRRLITLSVRLVGFISTSEYDYCLIYSLVFEKDRGTFGTLILMSTEGNERHWVLSEPLVYLNEKSPLRYFKRLACPKLDSPESHEWQLFRRYFDSLSNICFEIQDLKNLIRDYCAPLEALQPTWKWPNI